MRQKNCLIFVLVLFVTTLLLVGCSGEIARARFETVGENEITFQHDGSPVAFWTDFDVEYIVAPTVYYEIIIFQNGDRLGELICDPFDVKYQVMEREAEVGGKIKESYLGLMNCDAELSEGEITLNIELFADGGRVRIFRADLVLKEES